MIGNFISVLLWVLWIVGTVAAFLIGPIAVVLEMGRREKSVPSRILVGVLLFVLVVVISYLVGHFVLNLF